MANLRAKAKIVTIDPFKVAIYVRWSTDEQGEGTTLQIQLERCKQFILSQGWTINEDLIFIDDGYSGSTLERPGMKKLRKTVEDGLIDCVVIFKLDRLSRSILDTVNLVLDELEGNVCYIKSVTEPFDTTQQIGRQILTMLAGFAEWERYNIKLRTFEGKIETVEKGRSPGITPPYGYVVGDKTGTFKTVEHEANIIRRIFREYRNGKGTRAICAMLNNEGVTFRSNKKNNHNNKWNTSTIAYMLSNPLYIGQLVYGKSQNNPKKSKRENEPWRIKRAEEDVMVKDLTIDVITPIITVEEFDLVQKIKKSRNVFLTHETSGRKFSSPHLLSGLLRCKNCGYGLTARGKQKGDNYAYYVCRGNKMKGVGFCDAGAIRQDKLDVFTSEKLKQRFLNNQDSFFEGISEQDNIHLEELNGSLKIILDDLNRLENEFETIKIKLRRDNLDVNTFNMIKNDIDKENHELKSKHQNIMEEINRIKSKRKDPKEMKELFLMLNNWDNLEVEIKKIILPKLINYITVFKLKGKLNKDSEMDVYIDWK